MFKSSQSIASTPARVVDLRRAHSPLVSASGWAFGALCLLVLAGLALAIDVRIARLVQTSKSPGEVQNAVRLSETFAWGGTVAMIILTAAALDPRGRRIIPRLAIGAFGAGALADFLKLLLARTRPSYSNLEGAVFDTFVAWFPDWRERSLDLIYNHKLQSFPSAHTATAVGLAAALAFLYPRGRWLFAGFALLAGIQRVQSGAHFPSDVLAGAALGCLVGALAQADWGLRPWLLEMESQGLGVADSERRQNVSIMDA